MTLVGIIGTTRCALVSPRQKESKGSLCTCFPKLHDCPCAWNRALIYIHILPAKQNIKTYLECRADLEEEGEKLHGSSSERPLLVPCNSVRHNIFRDSGSRSNRVRVGWKSADVLPRRRACAGMAVSLAKLLHHQAVEGHGLRERYGCHIPCHLRYQHDENLVARVFWGLGLSARPKAGMKAGMKAEKQKGGKAGRWECRQECRQEGREAVS